jgi:hypothetical protein
MASPFCQIGFQGAKLFNVLQGCLTALFAFLIAKKMDVSKPWLAILFVIFTPMYFLMTLTGLTEIQFGFILVLSVYLFFDERYIASAIIISFIPLSRAEGYAFIPLFLLAFLMRRKYLAIPFLVSGILLFSIVGYLFIYKDFFWIYDQFPYPFHHPLYKHKGPLLYFVLSTPEIFGYPLLLLFLAGSIIYGYLFFRGEKEKRSQIFLEIWMLVVPVFLFFSVHSVLYWKAWFSSYGLIRVVTGVLPLAALVSLKAYDYIEKRFLKLILFRNVFLVITVFLIVFFNFKIHKFPVSPGPTEKTLRVTANWLRQTPLINNKILYTDLDFPFLLNLDPWDNKKCEQTYISKWLRCYPTNTVLIWDSYFSVNECFVPLDSVENTKEFKLVNLFRAYPEPGNWVDPDYNVSVFIKVPYGTPFDNTIIRDSINEMNNEGRVIQFLTRDDFEDLLKKNDTKHASSDFARSGHLSYKGNSDEPYILDHQFDISKIIDQKKYFTIRATCYIYPLVPFKENDTRLVITPPDNKAYYQSLVLGSLPMEINKWNKVSFTATFPNFTNSKKLNVYFWHLGKKEFYVDDLYIEQVAPR